MIQKRCKDPMDWDDFDDLPSAEKACDEDAECVGVTFVIIKQMHIMLGGFYKCNKGYRNNYEYYPNGIVFNKKGNSAIEMEQGYGAGSGRINNENEGGYGSELFDSTIGGYASASESGGVGGFMDERSCSMAPMRWCDQYPSFAKKCPQKCHGEPDNEMLNLRGGLMDSPACRFLTCNRDAVRRMCPHKCRKTRAGGSQCRGHPTVGMCEKLIEGYYFDSVSQMCISFKAGGCSLSTNGFRSREECWDRCYRGNRPGNGLGGGHASELEDGGNRIEGGYTFRADES